MRIWLLLAARDALPICQASSMCADGGMLKSKLGFIWMAAIVLLQVGRSVSKIEDLQWFTDLNGRKAEVIFDIVW